MAVNFSITVFLEATPWFVVDCYARLEERTTFNFRLEKLANYPEDGGSMFFRNISNYL
jgi:hypothetical protein